MKKDKQKFGYKGNYGLELVIDLKGCNLDDLSKEKLTKFMIELCDLIKMTRHGDPIFWEDSSDIPHLNGTSAFQFIETSDIVCHALPILKAVYLNIFSCKEFDPEDALKFCMKYWEATSENHTVITRV
jgi:S-adenosylmethionine/arginine decarboxylase-like enzyme